MLDIVKYIIRYKIKKVTAKGDKTKKRVLYL